MRKLVAVGCVAVAVLCLAGCDPNAGKNALEGTWLANLTAFMDIGLDLGKLPFVPNPDAKITFEDGEIDLRIDTDLPIIGWFVKGQIVGTYEKATKGVIDTVTLKLQTVKVRVIGIGVPVSDLNITIVAAYKIIGDELYIIPGYDQVPQAYRDQFENGTLDVPWQGNESLKIKPLVWKRK